ncbi:MAG: DUF4040 domain-containing protein [gamma proteobacterium symbiont of Bathyaustriella thionipta]|nr:DUF4040 domain-containing protein [gamma proteobacterium symbiont of Bathyaustriella thionipta]MCU7948841.1 DUF4040 domain-containing protein [gamma proteobacterium symbiont of Bathyaustriella thionipta]MCU7954348.1 DUF4040 domain-containing protein [gamma proteobacterium symbiont of Bathyaustriella thionipta]MCU7955299.1 DUF4040 domain-containing protein [gamma proteobacterium symbiont of Bathyaustriella thionipta]MCU7967128.1 DUF4040 domain-containing protein [gamma proteobacterium symbion
MTLMQLLFDTLLGFALLWLGWRALASPDLFQAIVLFIAFGLLMAIVWVRLDAPDVALAEAAIGAGLTGALLLTTLARLEAKNRSKSALEKKHKVWLMTENVKLKTASFLWLMVILMLLVSGLVYAVLTLQEQTFELQMLVSKNLESSGVSNPVTAVLLNFRGYDTLLEMSVLLLALLGVWSFGGIPKPHESLPGPVLNMLSRLLIPLLIIVAGYFLWVGSDAPGGAFQGGSVLGAAGVLLLLVGWRLCIRFVGLPLRIILVFGLGVFVSAAVVLIFLGRQFMEYPPSVAGALILLIEAAATLSIGITLAALFLVGRPEFRRHK